MLSFNKFYCQVNFEYLKKFVRNSATFNQPFKHNSRLKVTASKALSEWLENINDYFY